MHPFVRCVPGWRNLHKDKYFRIFFILNQIWIVNTLFRLISPQIELCSVPNQTEKCNLVLVFGYIKIWFEFGPRLEKLTSSERLASLGIMGPNWGAPWNSSNITSRHYDTKGFNGDPQLWAPLCQDTDSRTSDVSFFS